MVKDRITGIYALKNKENGKHYIGKSRDIKARIAHHLVKLRQGKGSAKLQNDFDKFGEECFEWFVVEEVSNNKNINEREDYYIYKFNAIRNGYNSHTSTTLGTNNVSSNITDDLKAIIIKDAKLNGITVSHWVRLAIEEKIERLLNNEKSKHQHQN